MAKTPRTRHSKTKREPVTIDLEADAVKRDSGSTGGKGGSSSTSSQADRPETGKAEAKAQHTAAASSQASAGTKADSPTGKDTEAKKPAAATSVPGAGKTQSGAETAKAVEGKAASGEKAGDKKQDAGAGSATKQGPGETKSSDSGAKPGDKGSKSGDTGAKARPVAASAPRSGGGARALMAGVAGGVIALALAGALQWANVLPVPRPQETVPDPQVESLRQELQSVSSELADLRQSIPEAPSDDAIDQALAGPREEIGALRESVDTLQEAIAAGDAGEGPGLEAVQTRLTDLETQLGDLETQLAEVSSAAGEAADTGGLEESVSGLQSSIETLRETVTGISETATANAERLATLEDRAAANEERLATLSERVEAQDEGPRLALVVAASALRAAIDDGEPFASELETYSTIASDTAALEPLRPHAETGIPSRAELAEQAPQVASRIAAATTQAPPDAGLIDRLLSSARSAITVRPVGEVEGETPTAIAARMEDAVLDGDYDKALAEYEALPPEAQEVASEFAEMLRARQAADRILEEALSSAFQPT